MVSLTGLMVAEPKWDHMVRSGISPWTNLLPPCVKMTHHMDVMVDQKSSSSGVQQGYTAPWWAKWVTTYVMGANVVQFWFTWSKCFYYYALLWLNCNWLKEWINTSELALFTLYEAGLPFIPTASSVAHYHLFKGYRICQMKHWPEEFVKNDWAHDLEVSECQCHTIIHDLTNSVTSHRNSAIYHLSCRTTSIIAQIMWIEPTGSEHKHRNATSNAAQHNMTEAVSMLSHWRITVAAEEHYSPSLHRVNSRTSLLRLNEGTH